MRFVLSFFIVFWMVVLSAPQGHAQSVTGYSIEEDVTTRVVQRTPVIIAQRGAWSQAYFDTEEDYTAMLYYDVQSNTVQYSPNGTAVNGSAVLGSPTSSGSLYATETAAGGLNDGIWSEITYHYLSLFYVVSAGGYSDPYDFSGFTGDVEGDYDTGYWIEVYVTLTTIAQQLIEIGETYSLNNHNTPPSGSGAGTARLFSVNYQAFIPPEWLYGPSAAYQCMDPRVVFRGDNRGFSPTSNSYRAFQQISLGVGGNTTNSPGFRDTGWTYSFAPDAIVNGHISSQALGATVSVPPCHLKTGVGKASTASIPFPHPVYTPVSYVGPNGVSSTHFTGSAADPLEPPSLTPSIDWDALVYLQETSPTNVAVTVIVNFLDCYPAHEISVGSTDVYTYLPPATLTFPQIAACLAGAGQIVGVTQSSSIPITSF